MNKMLGFGVVILLSALPAWGQCPSADLTRDCFVDLSDFAILAGQWLTEDPNKETQDLALLASQWLNGNRLPSDMILIPGGTFQMGDSVGDGQADELPVHAVTVDSFVMGIYEITNGQYCAFLNSAYPSQLKVGSKQVWDADGHYLYCSTSTSGYKNMIAFADGVFSVLSKGGRDMSRDPLVCVSWYGAAAYCNWRSRQEGREECYDLSAWTCDFSKRGYRLPTDAEWEYAARGGLAGRRYPWGDTISQTQANYYRHPLWAIGDYPYTSPVGFFDGTLKFKADSIWPGSETSFQTVSGANAYGLYDMAGNVWEWCQDLYGPYTSEPQSNPTGPVIGTSRIVRGGGWLHSDYTCRVSGRDFDSPAPVGPMFTLGFRIVLKP